MSDDQSETLTPVTPWDSRAWIVSRAMSAASTSLSVAWNEMAAVVSPRKRSLYVPPRPAMPSRLR